MKLRGPLALLVGIGAALRAVQYFSGGTLWVDEAALALNLAARSFRELLASPLDLAQVSPPGFLAVEKALLAAFGRSELALRLLPFAASVAALVLFVRLCRGTLSGIGLVFAAGSFALATGLIDYAGQLKQYSTDVAAAVAVLVLASSPARGRLTIRRAVAPALAGLAACLFSQPVVFVLAGVGMALVVLAALRRIEADVSALALLAVAWSLGAGFVLWRIHETVTPELERYLRDFWASGFPPREPAGAVAWLGSQVERIFGGFLDYPLPWLFVALVVLGIVSLCRRDLAAGLPLLFPLLLTVAAAAARLYPLAPGRVTAFAVPFFLLFAAEGFESLRRLPWRAVARAGSVVALIAAACPLLAVASHAPPYVHESLRPALRRLREARAPGDALYVFYGARLPYLFHEPRGGAAAGVVLGDCAREDPKRYLAELDRFRGRSRVWVLVSHDLPLFNEGPLLFAYLDRIGTPLERDSSRSGVDSSPVVLALYDLSDPRKLSAAGPDSFPIPEPPAGAAARLPCAGTMGPIPERLLSR